MERCCCPHTVDSDDSSQSSSPYQGIDKHTQVSPTQDLAAISTELPASFYAANRDNEMPPYPELSSVGTTLLPAREYEVFYDCNSENSISPKKSEHVKIDAKQVYKNLENPQLFRISLMKITILTQNLSKLFERQRFRNICRKCKCKAKKKMYTKPKVFSKDHRNKNSFNKIYTIDSEAEQNIHKYNDKKISSTSQMEPLNLNIPLKIHLNTYAKKNKTRNYSKCADPICLDVTKAANKETISPTGTLNTSWHVQEKSNFKSVETQTFRNSQYQEDFTPSWCYLKKPKLLQKCRSQNDQKTCVSESGSGFIPPCWSTLLNKEDIKSESCCKCGVSPKNCICDQINLKKDTNLEEIKPKLTSKEDATITPLASLKLSLESIEPPVAQTPLTAPQSSLASIKLQVPPSTPTNYEEDQPCDTMTLKELEDLIKSQKEATSLTYKANLTSSTDKKQPPLTPPKPPRKIYRLAFPQHKDLELWAKCRFAPSPLIDQSGKVFCPGNCGCCMCPWKSDTALNSKDTPGHNKITICKCYDCYATLTDLAETKSSCSQISYFDICPCREKAKARHMELYGFDITQQIFRGEEVLLNEVKELVPAKEGSTRFINSLLYKETKLE